MAYTPEQIAKMRQKEASLDDALKRDALTNYYEGYFFVTLNTRDEAPILSIVEGNPEANDNEKDAPRCVYTKLGRSVMNTWSTIPSYYPCVEVLAAEAMPEHFHGLIRLKRGNRKHLGHIIGGFMSGCTHAYWDSLGIDWHKNRATNGANALFPDRDRDHTRSPRGPSLFVRGYNDVEAITEQQIEIKRQYIRDQARKRLIKSRFHDRFRIYRACTSRGWTPDAIRRGLLADNLFAQSPLRLEAALQTIVPKLRTGLDYIGNIALLRAANKLPLICHRADAWCFEKQKRATLEAARNGAVIVSAFISAKEREIKNLLLAELLPMIEIMDNGFAERYKPIGKDFYACGENRMVQITPWKYEFLRSKSMTREMCMVMNQLVRVVTGVDDDWWKAEREEEKGKGIT